MRRRDRAAPPRAPGGVAHHGVLVLVAAVVLLVALVRVRLAEVPFERDEGEYAYAGQLILHGTPPYQLAYNMKFPGAYYAYALVMAVFGETIRGVRWGLLLVNVVTTLLVLRIGWRLFGRSAGAIAAIAFALLSADRWIMGIFAHATHFVLLPALAGLLLLLEAPSRRRTRWILCAGAALGVATLVKQHAFTFVPLGALVLWKAGADAGRDAPRDARRTWRELALLGAGAVLPLVVLAIALQAQGVLERAVFWTITYAREYVSEVPLSAFLPNLRHGLASIVRVTSPLWLIGGAGLIALWFGRWGAREKWILTALLAASFVAVCPGLYFRAHYFILMLPAVALLNGVACVTAGRLLQRALPASVVRIVAAAALLGIIVFLVARQRDYFFTMSPQDVSRERYGGNPFIESVTIGEILRQRTTPDDRIAVLGSEPQIYFYSGRRSATGYIYMYPLMERQPHATRMEAELIQEIEAAHPRYLVLVQVVTSWMPQTGDRRIAEWANAYTSRCYDLVGIADMVPGADTRYVWDDEVRGYQPRSSNLLFIFRSKSDAPCALGPLKRQFTVPAPVPVAPWRASTPTGGPRCVPSSRSPFPCCSRSPFLSRGPPTSPLPAPSSSSTSAPIACSRTIGRSRAGSPSSTSAPIASSCRTWARPRSART